MLPTINRATENTAVSMPNDTNHDAEVAKMSTSRGNQTFFTKPAFPINVPIDEPVTAAK